ncbi:hypothetical protein NL64_03045 [Pseudomonas fluorescens]|nr:hypothetical protein NL64_03045 [Pseudomonas fluorescens]
MFFQVSSMIYFLEKSHSECIAFYFSCKRTLLIFTHMFILEYLIVLFGFNSGFALMQVNEV